MDDNTHVTVVEIKKGIAFWQVWLTGALFTLGWFAATLEDGTVIDNPLKIIGVALGLIASWPVLLGVDISMLVHGIGG